jgi:hypothetical protein
VVTFWLISISARSDGSMMVDETIFEQHFNSFYNWGFDFQKNH